MRLIYRFFIFFSVTLILPVLSQGSYISIASGYTSFGRLDLEPAELKAEKNIATKLIVGHTDCLNTILCIGPEIGIGYYGESTWEVNNNPFKLASTGIDMSILWSINLHKDFYSLFKVGTLYHILFIDDPDRIHSKKSRIDSWMPSISVGLGYRLSEQFHLEGRFEGGLNKTMDHEDLQAGRRKSPSLAVFMLNLQYHF